MTDLELTTHVRCHEEELPALLKRFARVLLDIGFVRTDLDKQFAHVHWEADGSGFGYLCEPAVCDSIIVGGQPLTAQPYILGYTDSKGADMPWVQLSLVFDGQMVEAVTYSIDRPSRMKLSGAGAAIWRLACAYSEEFSESGIFFTDGPGVNDPWNALIGERADLWRFDLALIPAKLVSRFTPIPDAYAYHAYSNGLALALMGSWDVLPWLEASGIRENRLRAADVAAAIRDTLAAHRTKAALGTWAHRAMLADDAKTTPYDPRHRHEIHAAVYKLIFMAEGPEYELKDAELQALVQVLEKLD